MKKFLCLSLIPLLILFTFFGCVVSTDHPSITESDLNENELNIYTAMEDEQLEDYLSEFRSLYPNVKINITRDTTGVITSKLLAEKENPKADLIWGLSAISLLSLDQQNILEPFSPEGVDRVLPEFKDSANPPKWVGIDAWEAAFLVNKEVLASNNIADIPTSYYDLLDPKYKGLIAMSNPSSSGTAFITVSGILQLMGEEKGWDYLTKLNENVAVYSYSGDAPAKLAETGEYGIGFSYGYRCIKSVEKTGTNIAQAVFPKEGSGWDLEANALIKKDHIKDISKTFLSWAINDNCMDKYSKNYPMVTINKLGTLPEGYPSNPVEQLVKQDLSWSASNRERILNEWNRRFSSKAEEKN